MLFDTPLLNLASNTPVASSSSSTPNNKRKRANSNSTPSQDNTDQLAGAAINVDKLLKHIKNQGDNHSAKGKQGGGDKPQGKKPKKEHQPKERQELKPQQQHFEQSQSSNRKGGKGKNKRDKRKSGDLPPKERSSSPPTAASHGVQPIVLTPGMTLHRFSAPSQSLPSPSTGATTNGALGGGKKGSVQDKLRAQLAGGKFRMLNEQLYTTSGGEAYRLMKDEGAFDDYHIGFRSQAATWPVHPLTLIARALLDSLPANSLIADFGCGDAALARSLCPAPSSSSASASLPPIPSLKLPAKLVAQKALKVISLDLVSQSSFVVEAECHSVPLPGGTAGGEIVDAVVCCLSLMGTDWIGMVREARRVLKDGGVLKIAEVTSRFPSLDDFIKLLASLGFTLSHKDDSNTHFLLLDFTKSASSSGGEGENPNKVQENSRKAEKLLNPCIYKRR
ncbi:hypothetical protein JCM8097_007029 [Rhodosporidiobolus ruineniae]